MLFDKLKSRDDKFFECFAEHGAYVAQGARAYAAMLDSYADRDLRQAHAAEVDRAERGADLVTAEVNRLLLAGRSCSLGRDRVLAMINGMDDIVDLLRDASETLYLYDVRSIPDEVKQLGQISLRCCERVHQLIGLLPQLGQEEVARAAIKTCDEIDQLESDADRVKRAAIAALFRSEPDVRELIKLKAVYEQLEGVSDCCEDVADLVEAIILGSAN